MERPSFQRERGRFDARTAEPIREANVNCHSCIEHGGVWNTNMELQISKYAPNRKHASTYRRLIHPPGNTLRDAHAYAHAHELDHAKTHGHASAQAHGNATRHVLTVPHRPVSFPIALTVLSFKQRSRLLYADGTVGGKAPDSISSKLPPLGFHSSE